MNDAKIATFSKEDTDRIIGMAWEDRTSFDAIKRQFNLSEAEVIKLMRNNMKRKSWKRWRERVNGRKTKHDALKLVHDYRFKCSRQKEISNNRISKR